MPERLIVLPPLGRVPAGIHGTGRKVARIALVTLLLWAGLIGLAWYVLDRIAAAPLPASAGDPALGLASAASAHDRPIAAARPAMPPHLAGQASLNCAGGDPGLSTADDDATPPAAFCGGGR